MRPHTRYKTPLHQLVRIDAKSHKHHLKRLVFPIANQTGFADVFHDSQSKAEGKK
jgi:hypothetical protein